MGDENGYGSGECGNKCGDGHAEETSPAGILPPPLNPSPHPITNQSKPIVPTLSFSPITSRYTIIISSSSIITSSYTLYNLSL